MKVYISADIEGVCGATTWDEVARGSLGYADLQRQMTAEVKAACEGAFEAGAREIVIKDAHDSACNLIAADLPENTRLIKGWSRHPYMMMQELDGSFDAVLMIGYHSFAGGGGNPLAHTMNTTRNYGVRINGTIASEFMINWFTAMLEEVPVVFISGDQEICSQAADLVPSVHSVAVKIGLGASTVNIHPRTALSRIRNGVAQALSDTSALRCVELPAQFEVELSFTNNRDAYRASFYPGAALVTPRSLRFQADNYFDVLRFFLFTM